MMCDEFGPKERVSQYSYTGYKDFFRYFPPDFNKNFEKVFKSFSRKNENIREEI